jgi:hypothetical protein
VLFAVGTQEGRVAHRLQRFNLDSETWWSMIRAMAAIAGLICGLVLAVNTCVPIYDFLWPHASDRNQGGVGFFLVLVLAPVFMFVGMIAGVVVGGWASKKR